MSSSTERLFFALWPDTATRQALAQLNRQCDVLGGRAMQPANLHVTLAFLGNVTAEYRACMSRYADAVRETPFSLSLTRLGVWPQSGIYWLAPEVTPAPLLRLADGLNRAIESCGGRSETRPYRPHVTLRRKVKQAPSGEVSPPIVWSVGDFVLVQSHTHQEGVEYRVVQRWPLCVAT